MIGQTLGSYRVTGKLGEGGMGVVYLAEHPLIGRKAAIKLLLPEFSQDQAIVNRFFNEARATTMIKHPGLVDVFDFGYHTTGCAYIVMEFLEGESLSGLLKREGRLSAGLIVAIVRQLCSAVGAAHEKGIVHRDLKPDNIYLLPDRDSPAGIRVKVLDFGIAKLAGEGGSGMVKTRTGSMMGTPLYMSPEQCRGLGSVDHRADIYSLGCIMFEMACGRVPFTGEGAGDLIVKHIMEPPPMPSAVEPSLPPALEAVILHCMAKTPEQRPYSMGTLLQELEGVAVGRTPTAPHLQTVTMSATRPGSRPGTGPGSWPGPSVSHTTLGSAASQIHTGPPAPARGKKLWLALAAVVAVGGAVGIYLATRPKGDEQQAAASPSPQAAPSPTAPAATAPPQPGKVKLTVTSQPAGADVYSYATGVRLGKTPLTQELAPTAGELVFLLKLAGYEDQQVTLAADQSGEQAVTLVAKPEPTVAAATGKPDRRGNKKPSPSASPSKSPAASPSPTAKPDTDGTRDPFAD